MRILLQLILLILFLPAALALIDIVEPDNNEHTNADNVTFNYYVGVENPISCTMNIPPQSLPDLTVQQGLNAFIIQGIDEGSYDWSVACENATETQTSETRTLIMDYTAPVIQLTRPDEAAPELIMRLIVTDDVSNTFSCDVRNNESLLDTITIQNNQYYEANYDLLPGAYELEVTCTDKAGNNATVARNYTIEKEDYFFLTTDKKTYGLGEDIQLTIDAPSDASITIDICPDEQGFVECVSPLIVPGFPQTLQLPLNQSGDYLIEGIMTTPRGTLINSTTYTVENTMTITLETDRTPRLAEEFTLTANVIGAIGDVTFSWELHNKVLFETNENTVDILPDHIGIFTETVTVTDAANNQKVESITYTVDEDLLVSIKVIDEQNKLLGGATVQLEDSDQTYTTLANGAVDMRLEFGTSKLYATKEGYVSFFGNVFVDENTTEVLLTLSRESAIATITIDSPTLNAQFSRTGTVDVKFTVHGISNGTCNYYMALDNESFLQQQASVAITGDGQYGFTLSELDTGRHAYTVECEQGRTTTSSEKRHFTITESTVVPSATPVYEEDPNSERELFENALTSIRALGPKEQELIAALELESLINKARKQSGQLSRNIFDMQYRNDLSETEKQAEQQRLRTQIDTLLETTPISIEILDQRTIVDYISEEELQNVLEEHGETLNIPLNALAVLADAQQSYTMKTILYRARIKYGDGEQTIIGVVSKTFTYGLAGVNNEDLNARFLEIIPKTLTKTAKDIVLVTKNAKVLVDDPILQFPIGTNIVYYISKEISLSELEDVRTMFVPKISVSDNAITGLSFFGASQLSGLADNLGISFSVLIALLVAAYLSYYFGLIGRVKYLFYQGGPKTKLHYMRVLLNDVYDNIQANNYDKALLIYKEIKLTYDQLEIPTKNELFEEITMVCAELDKSFMKQLVVEMDAALKKDELQMAIEYYARIEATYERLPPTERQQVHTIVVGLGKRLGLGVPA